MDPSDLCPRPLPLPPLATTPHAPPIYPTSVWACESPQQADDMLAGRLPGYVYQRDGHPNAYLLAEKCRQLHSADRAAVTASGMGALAVAMLSQLAAGDHALLGSRLYGKSHQLFGVEAGRLGIEMTTVDT
jgi:O-acetylhomoserine/O-acetylserine sulfhydrylase-like pyridoxal-dependent enzyme